MIDVIICTYNPNLVFLKRTVDAIVQQDLNKNLWQLTIIDNNSSSPVKDIPFVKELNIKVVSEQKPGLTAARKCAANIATQEIIVFVDDDNVLQADYLTLVKDAFADDELSVLSGAIIPEYVHQPEEWFLEHEGMLAIKRIEGDKIIYNQSLVCNDYFSVGAGMAIRTQLLRDYFNSPINDGNLIEGRIGNELSSCEDMDIDFFALYKDKKIGCYPKMKITHIIPPERLSLKYLNKLSVSTLKSSFMVNKKWSPVFKHNVFEIFDYKNSKILFTIIINKIGGLFDKTRYLRYNLYLALYKLKKQNHKV